MWAKIGLGFVICFQAIKHTSIPIAFLKFIRVNKLEKPQCFMNCEDLIVKYPLVSIFIYNLGQESLGPAGRGVWAVTDPSLAALVSRVVSQLINISLWFSRSRL